MLQQQPLASTASTGWQCLVPTATTGWRMCTVWRVSLNYAILVWGFKCNRLVELQKRLVRIITCSRYNAHTDPLFKSTEILKVANILDLNALKFYYKYIHGKLPSYFYSFNIVTQGSQHSYNTRQSEQIRTEPTRAEYCDNRLKYFYHRNIVTTDWNIYTIPY